MTSSAPARHRAPRAVRRPAMRPRPPSIRGAAPTFGVEEEFLLLDPVQGLPVPAAPAMLRLLHGEPGPQAELMRHQFETATAICTNPDELSRELSRLRTLGAEAARTLGCRLVSAGTAPYGTPGLSALTDRPRYQELARRYPALTAVSGTCGCHVHVGVPTRDLGVRILARLRPWLATVLAISANSPIADGHDTGRASRRYEMVARWPTASPPGEWNDAAAYDRAVRRLLDRGAALDERSVYFLARLSPRFPTVEVRVADACVDIETTVLVATLVRALVATAAADTRAAAPLLRVPRELVVAGLAAAARNGLGGVGVDPFTGRLVPAWDLVDRLLDQAGWALTDLGDAATVVRLLARLRDRGTGADRQRELWTREESPADVATGLAAMTISDPDMTLASTWRPGDCRPSGPQH